MMILAYVGLLNLYMIQNTRKGLLSQVDSEGLDQPAHPCSLIRAFIVSLQRKPFTVSLAEEPFSCLIHHMLLNISLLDMGQIYV